MAGRPRKPDAVKKLQGTYQKCRDTNPVEFKIATNDLAFGRDWESIMRTTVDQLREVGIVSDVDLGLVEGYAKALERYIQADEQLRVEGMVVIGVAGLKPSVWFEIAERSLKQATQIGQLFGITPSARARIPQQGKPESKLELLKKKIS